MRLMQAVFRESTRAQTYYSEWDADLHGGLAKNLTACHYNIAVQHHVCRLGDGRASCLTLLQQS